MQRTVVVDTPAGIQFFHLCALRGAIRLESVGMKRRGRSALSVYKEEFKSPKATAKQALEHLNLIIGLLNGGARG